MFTFLSSFFVLSILLSARPYIRLPVRSTSVPLLVRISCPLPVLNSICASVLQSVRPLVHSSPCLSSSVYLYPLPVHPSFRVSVRLYFCPSVYLHIRASVFCASVLPRVRPFLSASVLSCDRPSTLPSSVRPSFHAFCESVLPCVRPSVSPYFRRSSFCTSILLYVRGYLDVNREII